MADYKKGKGKGEGVNSERGVALIAAVLAVVILMAIGISFAFTMRLEEKAAVNFMYSVKANYIAQAGIDRAIAELRTDANPGGGHSFATTEHDQFGDAWNPFPRLEINHPDINLGGGVTGTYTVTVVDTARRIHLNDFNNPNLGTVLENLVAALRTAEATVLEAGDGTSIHTNRPDREKGGYITPSQITVVAGSTITEPKYRALRNYLTSEGYFNPNRFRGRSAVNINTADQYTLQAIFQAISPLYRDTIVQAILEYRVGREYDIDPDGIWGNNDRWRRTPTLIGAGNPNPFDGIDTNRWDGIDPVVTGFVPDGLDNDGDGTRDNLGEAHMFAGGARGEFMALLNYLNVDGAYSTETAPGISAGAVIASNANANPALLPTTVGLDFESKFFAITSTGTITRGGEQLAESKIIRIVERER